MVPGRKNSFSNPDGCLSRNLYAMEVAANDHVIGDTLRDLVTADFGALALRDCQSSSVQVSLTVDFSDIWMEKASRTTIQLDRHYSDTARRRFHNVSAEQFFDNPKSGSESDFCYVPSLEVFQDYFKSVLRKASENR
jgi:hypothetical protein